MALSLCPECIRPKFFLAPRCNHCNQEIGFLRQLAHTYAQWGTAVCTLWFIMALFTGGAGWVLLFWLLVIFAPAMWLATVTHPDN